MGCNCGKNRLAYLSNSSPKRVTVYQVLDGSNQVVEEFNALADARSKATSVGGRVKVTTKTVPA